MTPRQKLSKPLIQHATTRPPNTVEVVDPRWLLRAFLLALGVAALFGYAAVCWIFWHGQWQLVLHPSRTVAATPASVSLQYQAVRFGPVDNGQPALTGWWVPAATQTTRTALLIHGADGNMASVLPAAAALHGAGMHVLLFDPRGYGTSAGHHPTQNSMQQDTAEALRYLIGVRGLQPSQIIPFGVGAGASLAVTLATAHPELPAIVLEDARGDFRSFIQRQNRSRLLPVGLLFTQDFPLARPLTKLSTPKLLISYTAGAPPVEVQQAASPKQTIEIPPGQPETSLTPQLTAFLDQYLR